jgi:hypothetical protein
MNATSGQDSLFDMASDLEGVLGKLEALESLIGVLTEDTDLTMFALLHSMQFIRKEAQGVSRRLYVAARASRPR